MAMNRIPGQNIYIGGLVLPCPSIPVLNLHCVGSEILTTRGNKYTLESPSQEKQERNILYIEPLADTQV